MSVLDSFLFARKKKEDSKDIEARRYERPYKPTLSPR